MIRRRGCAVAGFSQHLCQSGESVCPEVATERDSIQTPGSWVVAKGGGALVDRIAFVV